MSNSPYLTVDRSRIDKELQDKTDYRWWLDPEEKDVYHKVMAVVSNIEENNLTRDRQNYIFMTMYKDVDYGFFSGSVDRFLFPDLGDFYSQYSKITLNVVRNCIDAFSAMIAKNHPHPLFITDGSDDYNDVIKAQKLTKYVQGVIDDIKLYQIAEKVFTDGAIYGTGFFKFYIDPEKKKIQAEWLWPGEVLIDDLDGMKENPSQMHHRTYISRDVLAERFPDKKEDILKASSNEKMNTNHKTVSDLILVIESWHLPSGPKAQDGKHTICISNATLFSEEYNKDYFPILPWRWMHSSYGFWGRGIAEELGKIQRTINQLVRTIDDCQRLVGVPIVVASKGSMIAMDATILNDEIGHVIEYLDTPPQFLTPPAVAPEIYQYIQWLKNEAYNIVGLSQSVAQGEKPVELRSGAAIREASDMAYGRVQNISLRWDATYIEIANIIVDMSKDLHKLFPELKMMVVDDENKAETLDWAKVDMERDRLKIKVFNISGLPSTPAGKIETLTEWVAAGWVSKEFAMSLLNFPDIKRFANLETSTLDLTQKIIGQIKETGQYTPEMKPIKEMQLPLAIKVAEQEMCRAKEQEVSPEVMDKLDLFSQDLHILLAQAQMAAQANMPPQQTQPPGPPMGPPSPPNSPPQG